jgi:hypothetical protein
LTEIGVEQNSTIVFPVPIDIIGLVAGITGDGRRAAAQASTALPGSSE